MTETKYWLGIACADHVQRGQTEGFMQVCHGKPSQLRRMRKGDGILFYSPAQTMSGKDRLQSFTAQGILPTDNVYQADMSNGFCPYRRDVHWNKTKAISIRPFLDQLELTKGKSNWAYPFRFGLLEISADDFNLVSEAMLVER